MLVGSWETMKDQAQVARFKVIEETDVGCERIN
jgi:hypothetical protein